MLKRFNCLKFDTNNFIKSRHEVVEELPLLDEASNIIVRSGHHCCMPLIKYFGLKVGAVRASFYLYNTEEEVDTFLETVKEIAKC